MALTRRPLRVLLAKIGLDGHDRGIKVVARLLRDDGHEVIYLGRRQPPEYVVRVAIDEDVDVIGLSFLAGTHRAILDELLELLEQEGMDVPVVIGGTILRREIEELEGQGVAAVFPVGTPLQVIRDQFAAF